MLSDEERYDEYLYTMMPRTINIVVRSICCAKIKGQVDDFTESEKTGESDENGDTTDESSEK